MPRTTPQAVTTLQFVQETTSRLADVPAVLNPDGSVLTPAVDNTGKYEQVIYYNVLDQDGVNIGQRAIHRDPGPGNQTAIDNRIKAHLLAARAQEKLS